MLRIDGEATCVVVDVARFIYNYNRGQLPWWTLSEQGKDYYLEMARQLLVCAAISTEDNEEAGS
jgi:hypothetical protein